MDRYKAVTEYLLEALTDLGAPSEPIVFCRVTGTKLEDVEEVEFLAEGASIVVTDMVKNGRAEDEEGEMRLQQWDPGRFTEHTSKRKGAEKKMTRAQPYSAWGEWEESGGMG
jgi:hypothetical protein